MYEFRKKRIVVEPKEPKEPKNDAIDSKASKKRKRPFGKVENDPTEDIMYVSEEEEVMVSDEEV